MSSTIKKFLADSNSFLAALLSLKSNNPRGDAGAKVAQEALAEYCENIWSDASKVAAVMDRLVERTVKVEWEISDNLERKAEAMCSELDDRYFKELGFSKKG